MGCTVMYVGIFEVLFLKLVLKTPKMCALFQFLSFNKATKCLVQVRCELYFSKNMNCTNYNLPHLLQLLTSSKVLDLLDQMELN